MDNSHLIARFSKSLVGRLNADVRSVEALLAVLPKPKIWDVEGRVRGMNLGNSRFQFDFNTQADLLKVLSKRPCHFNNWSFPLERWEPHVGDIFPNTMTFWISVQGIPTHFWLTDIFQEIGRNLGVVRAIDADTARVQVTVNVDEPLKFARKARLPSGEIVKLELKYERLFRWCFNCGHISHEERTCPSLTEAQRQERRAAREAARELTLENHEGRIRTRDSPLRVNPETASIPYRLRRVSEETNTLPEGEHRSHGAWGEYIHGSHHNGRKSERLSPTLRERKDCANVWNRLESSGLEGKERQYADRFGNTLPKGNSSSYTEAPYRKRRYEDSVRASKGIATLPKEVPPAPTMDRRRVPEPESSKAHAFARPQASDPQQTISDPPRRVHVARPLNSSPDHQRSRSIHLNL